MGSELDFSSLEKSFDLNSLIDDDHSQNNELCIFNKSEKTKDELIENQGDSEKILRMNIDRANTFLDLVEAEFSKGGAFNSKMLEAASRLISEVTNAGNALKGLEIQDQTIDIKQKTLDLKEFEIKNRIEKGAEREQKNVTNNTTNNTVVLTDRESLLNMFKNEPEIIDITSE